MSVPAGSKSGPAATAPTVRSNSISSKSETPCPSPLRGCTATQLASSSRGEPSPCRARLRSNRQAWQWCRENGVEFTRGRPYRKNDHCFVEQKNGGVIRKAVGYHRFDSDQETAALAEVYRRLCPLVNCWYPSIKVTGKERLESGKLKKKYDVPKTPYQRLLESPDLSDTVKKELTRRAQATNPVTLMRLENQAVATLFQMHTRKNREVPPPVSDSYS